MVEERRVFLVGDEEEAGWARIGEEGEGGTDGEGDGEADEADEDDIARARTSERKRWKAPVWFHTRVLSPPSKSSSSEEESMSVSPGPSDGRVAASDAGRRLYAGKMRGAGVGAQVGVGNGVGGASGSEEEERGGGGSICTAP
jgi:hypothetical protein